MIQLTRVNGQPLLVNCDLIESVETGDDTIVTLVNGNKLIVRDSMETIRERVLEFKRRIYLPPGG